ncbi:hypothetical protein HY768_09025 [candidate division TA06 bacterium]|uniref:Oligosaccharide repeat unit polymerase n=1 Tax=candidate division TA06 bacterium TaxID=2250710 RepID=A0A933MLC4_UNCT6|nr:hypothetical protein [candidate division TA06 bacterium]
MILAGKDSSIPVSQDVERELLPPATMAVKKRPLLLLLLWLITTVLLFIFGPYSYSFGNKIQLYTYLAAVHIALYAGYCLGLRTKPQRPKVILKGLALAKISLLFSGVLLMVNLLCTGGGDIGRLALAIKDPGAAYAAGSTKGGVSIFNYIGIFSAPVSMMSFVLGTYYWARLRVVYKILLASLFATAILSSIGASVRSTIIITGLYAAAAFGAAYQNKIIHVTSRAKLMLVVVLVCATVVFFKYFAFLTENRQQGDNRLRNPLTNEMPAQDHPMYKILPEAWHNTYTIAAFYISHSYYRLAQALNMPFIGIGWGASNSAFLVRNIVRLTGWTEFENYSYGMRLDRMTGYGDFGLAWSTIYTWIASDVTFPGSVLIIFMIGYFFARAWTGVLEQRGPLSVMAFACFVIIVFSFPMNNPLQDGPGISTYFGIPFLWWLNRG